MLNGWQSLRVVRIAAPAGYGKSTFVAQWLENLAAEAPDVFWLTMSEQDDQEGVFLQHLDAALSPLLPELRAPFAAERSGYVDRAVLARTVFREISGHARHVILVLDDLHLLKRPGEFAFFQCFVDAAPPNLHVVTISREVQHLPLGRLLIDESVVSLDMHDLRFDASEFREFVRRSRLSALNEGNLATIERTYEGWIAALRLLALTISNSAAGNSFTLRTSHGTLDEYLEAEAFARMPSDLRRLLLETAYLPFVSPQLASAVSGVGVATCARLLHDALATHAFTARYIFSNVSSNVSSNVDDCYRCHPLFQQFLRRRLTYERSIDETRRIRRKTAAVLVDHEEIDAALGLLHEDDDVQQQVETITAQVRPALLRGNLSAAKRWLAAAPSEAVRVSPQLAVDRALTAYLADDPKMVEYADAALHATSALSIDAPLRRDAVVLSAIASYISGDTASAVRSLQIVWRRGDMRRDFAAGYASFMCSVTAHECTNVDERVMAMANAASIFTDIGFDHGAVETTVLPGLLLRRTLDIDGAVASLQHATVWITERGFGHHLYATDAHVAHGEVLYFSDRIAEAYTAFRQAQHTNAQLGPVPVNSSFILAGMHLCSLAAGEALDDRTLDEDMRLWATVRATAWPVMVSHVGWLRILRDARMGRTAHCWQTAQSLPGFSTNIDERMPDLTRLAILGAAVFSGRRTRTLVAQLDEFRRYLAATGNSWLEIFALALQVRNLEKTNDDTDLLRYSSELHALIARTGLKRILSDIVGYRTANSAAAPFDLTLREIDVLQLLMDGRRTPDIEKQLCISNTTVRAHLRSIFRKLGVHSRVEAIKAAREAGIAAG